MSDAGDQGEDPIRALVDRLRFNALERWDLPIDLDCAPDPLPSSLASDEEWQAAEALLSLSQERDRLREQVKALEQSKSDLMAENSQFDDLRTEIVSIRERMAENMAAISAMTAENILLANERDRLREALQNMVGLFDNPVERIRWAGGDGLYEEAIATARAALQKEPS